jgi:hypothetical protein
MSWWGDNDDNHVEYTATENPEQYATLQQTNVSSPRVLYAWLNLCVDG